MKHGYIRVGSATINAVVANCKHNQNEIVRIVKEAASKKVKVLALSELCVTSYTCADLFLQSSLQNDAIEAINNIALETKNEDVLFAIGAPLRKDDQLYDCAIVLHKGKILAVIPKTNIPNYGEFYEKRHFSEYFDKKNSKIYIGNKAYPFGTRFIFECTNLPLLTISFELGEDLWVANSPSINHSLAGAKVILNLSGSSELVSKNEYRRDLVTMHSAKINTAYVYSNCGNGESTTDLVYGGHNLIAENGTLLSEAKLFANEFIYADIDLELLSNERRKMIRVNNDGYKVISFTLDEVLYSDLARKVCPSPFVNTSKKLQHQRNLEILEIQAQGLKKRLEHINCKNVVIGISGGLDSTLALLVINRTFEILDYDKKGIHAITMPCFGTSKRTYENAYKFTSSLGISLKEISIKEAVIQHFLDIEHDKNKLDVTFENAQARERTQVLMDYSNKVNGIVVGTGDLSELALGWATYNGDHMSMYGVNGSIPKTLVRSIVDSIADNSNDDLKFVLKDILDTPISPELLPTKNEEIAQKTEDNVGPYELHDFFLFYTIRYGFSVEKIFFLASKAFAGKYDKNTIKKWLRNFYYRFFAQQFKRSCLPDGVKVGSVGLSPRGDLKMPSDASSKTWIERVEKL